MRSFTYFVSSQLNTKRRETVGTDTVRCVLLESPWEDMLKSQVREDMTVNSTCHTTSQHANS